MAVAEGSALKDKEVYRHRHKPQTGGNMDREPTTSRPLEHAFTFHGSYTRAVDAKGRFNLPFRFRQVGQEERYVVSKGADVSLTLLPYSVWIENFNRMREGQPGAQLRKNLRSMSLASKVVEPDSQGRVAVTPEILKACGVTQKITIVGMGSYMELWDPQTLEGITSGSDELDSTFMDEFYL